MKRIIYLIFTLAILLNCKLHAQFDYFGPPDGITCISGYNGELYASKANRIYRSTNDGVLWTEVKSLRNGANIKSILVTKDATLVGTEKGGYASYNNGESWILINKYGILNFINTGDKVYAIDWDNNNSNVQYLGVSTNGGLDWSGIKTNLKNSERIKKICKSGNSLFGVSYKGVVTSADGGSNWTVCSTDLVKVQLEDICTYKDYIFVSSYKYGIYVSSDKGATWKQSNKGLQEINNLQLSVCDSLVYAASPNTGLFVSLDKGATWQQIERIIPNPHLTCIFSDGITIYISSTSSILKSKDKGATWRQINDGITTQASVPFILENSNIYTIKGSGLFVGKNNGKHWEEIFNAGSIQDYTENKYFTTLYKNGSEFFLVQYPNFIFTSDDGGYTWSSYKGSGIYPITCLLMLDNTLIAGTKGASLYISKNKGVEWTDSNMGCFDFNILQLASYKNKAYAVGDSSVYLSSDAGTTWEELTKWPKGIQTIHFNQNEIFVAGRFGAFVSSDDGATFNQINSDTAIKSIYSIGDTTILCNDSLYISKSKAYKWENITSFNFAGKCVAANSDNVYISSYNGIGVGGYSFDLSGPKLIYPSNKSLNIPYRVELEWIPTLSADSSHYQVSLDSNFTNIIAEKTTNFIIAQISDLYNSSQYFWRVQTFRNNQKSPWSETRTFTTMQLESPQLNSPANNEINIMKNNSCSWATRGQDGKFRLQISTDSTFSHIVLDSSARITYIELLTLSNNTKYYWRVNLENNGKTSNWSEIWSFTTKALNIPKLSSPSNGDLNVNTKYEFYWNNNDKSRIQISKDSAFKNIIIDSSLSNTSLQISGLSYKTKYYWRVRAFDDVSSSEWSEIWSFTTFELVAPTLISPYNQAWNMPSLLEFKWSWFDNIKDVNYTCQLALDSSFTTIIPVEVYYAGVSKAVMVKKNTKYFWRVNAKVNGDLTPWSEIRDFTTAKLVPPILSSPINGKIDLKPNFAMTWLHPSYADTYRCQIATDSSFAKIVFDRATPKLAITTDSLVSSTKYYWRVQSGYLGEWSDWSEVCSFTTFTLSAPTLSAPANNSINIPVNTVLSWNYGFDIDGYHYQVASDSSFKKTIFEQSCFGKQVKLPTLANLTKYYWRIYAKNAADISPWSETWSFTTVESNGVENYTNGAEKISISPNPASDVMTINYKFEDADAVNLKIYNILGEEILFKPNLNPAGTSRIDISGFYPGNYRLVFEAGGRKVIKTACVCR